MNVRSSFVAALASSVALVVTLATSVLAAVPGSINYQGFLRDDGGVPFDGSATLAFSVYATETGGSPSWSEDHGSVAVDEGVFHVLLGSVTPFPADFFAGTDRWLEISVGGEVLTPRRAFVAVPYALRAAVAEVALTGGDAVWTVNGPHVYRSSGNVGVGTSAPAERLHITDPVFSRILLDRTGGAQVRLVAEGSTGAVGTSNAIPFRLLSNNSVRMSIEPSGNVGIGTVSPALKLSVNGDAEASTLRANESLGSSGTPVTGGVYGDNVVYAWGRINGAGTIESSYGILSVTRLGTGWYRITFAKSLPSAVIPTAIVYSANDVVVARVAATSSSTCDIRLDLWNPGLGGGAGGFEAVDYRFLVQVVGRP